MKFAAMFAILLATFFALACGSAYPTHEPTATVFVAPAERTVVPAFPSATVPGAADQFTPAATPNAEEAVTEEGAVDGSIEISAPVENLDQPTATASTTEDLYAVSYLEATVEPCSPVDGSQIDPCERRRWRYETWVNDYIHPDQVIHSMVERDIGPIAYPPRPLREVVREYFQELNTPGSPGDGHIPHFIVRGVFLPGTTRCQLHETLVQNVVGEGLQIYNHPIHGSELGCYADFEVRDYLVGRGPQMLVLRPPGRVPYAKENHEIYKTDDYLAGLASHVGKIWEGSEFAVVVGLNRNSAVEVWQVKGVSDVQRREDGEVITSSPFLDRYREDQPIEPYLDILEPRVDDIKSEIAQAHADAAEEFGIVRILDANLKFLKEYLDIFGIYDIEGVEISPPLRIE